MALQMGVKIKMVTGDALAIARKTAGKLGLGANILDAAGLSDVKHQETAPVAESIDQNLSMVSMAYCQCLSEYLPGIMKITNKDGLQQ
ncbi:MAG: hypothetical protein P4L55_01860 [Syntrophobacteraceae bacterium]|nr:hypothetical protein [Syntrophobacteraceae bacterium]